MKYMLLINSTEAENEAAGDNFDEWMSYDKALRDSGACVAGHALADLTTATTVRVNASGERTITDGPYAEAREILGGYYVIDVPDLDVALDWAARCPGAKVGSIVVRPVAEF